MRPGYLEEHEYDRDDERDIQLVVEARALVRSLSWCNPSTPLYQKAIRRVQRRSRGMEWAERHIAALEARP